MSLGVNDLKPKMYFIHEGQPCVVEETHHLKMQQRRPVMQTRFRNLISGKVLDRNFAQSDTFEEADVQRTQVKFLYANRGEYWFADPNNPSKRFKLPEKTIGEQKQFLKPNILLDSLEWDEKVINVSLPIKMEFEVVEAPPNVKGDTATGGTKQVKLDSGATINVPLFITQGDRIIVNTETSEYSERAK